MFDSEFYRYKTQHFDITSLQGSNPGVVLKQVAIVQPHLLQEAPPHDGD